jgi:hypothetical protein
MPITRPAPPVAEPVSDAVAALLAGARGQRLRPQFHSVVVERDIAPGVFDESTAGERFRGWRLLQAVVPLSSAQTPLGAPADGEGTIRLFLSIEGRLACSITRTLHDRRTQVRVACRIRSAGFSGLTALADCLTWLQAEADVAWFEPTEAMQRASLDIALALDEMRADVADTSAAVALAV